MGLVVWGSYVMLVYDAFYLMGRWAPRKVSLPYMSSMFFFWFTTLGWNSVSSCSRQHCQARTPARPNSQAKAQHCNAN